MISADKEALQAKLLPGVSRTFALTIPRLPAPLRCVVTHAYLLCRIVDTIEDSDILSADQKAFYANLFTAAVSGDATPDAFALAIHDFAKTHSVRAERDLLLQSADVIAIGRGYSAVERKALQRCIRIMSHGMAEFAAKQSKRGLDTRLDLDRYCYYVAGVVGELLTELFCAYRPDLEAKRHELMPLAVSFGQGLQMTNILKDIWDDRKRDACWLPRDIFAQHGFDLDHIDNRFGDASFVAGLTELIAIARRHLENALHYVELLPRDEPGIRQFCLWALGMAVLTLRKIQQKSDFTSGSAVKISRRTVRATIAVTNLASRSNLALRGLFAMAASGLPTVSGPIPISTSDAPRIMLSR